MFQNGNCQLTDWKVHKSPRSFPTKPSEQTKLLEQAQPTNIPNLPEFQVTLKRCNYCRNEELNNKSFVLCQTCCVHLIYTVSYNSSKDNFKETYLNYWDIWTFSIFYTIVLLFRGVFRTHLNICNIFFGENTGLNYFRETSGHPTSEAPK